MMATVKPRKGLVDNPMAPRRQAARCHWEGEAAGHPRRMRERSYCAMAPSRSSSSNARQKDPSPLSVPPSFGYARPRKGQSHGTDERSTTWLKLGYDDANESNGSPKLWRTMLALATVAAAAWL